MVDTLQPIVFVPVISLIVALGLAVLAFRASRLNSRVLLGFGAFVLCLPAAFLYVVVFHEELIDERVRAYKKFYSDIPVGMTRAELFALLDHDYPADGPRTKPKLVEETEEHISFCMSPEKERDPNCEGISVYFQGGRSVRKDYVRD